MAAAPLMALAGWHWGAMAAAAALLLWIVLGAAIPALSRLPYSPGRRIKPHRLFLSYATALALLSGISRAGNSLLSPAAGTSPLLVTGNVCFALILCQQLIRLSLPKKISWGVGGALCAAACAAWL